MVGSRTIPLVYVIHDTVDIPVFVPALMLNQPYAEELGSVEEEFMGLRKKSDLRYMKVLFSHPVDLKMEMEHGLTSPTSILGRTSGLLS